MFIFYFYSKQDTYLCCSRRAGQLWLGWQPRQQWYRLRSDGKKTIQAWENWILEGLCHFFLTNFGSLERETSRQEHADDTDTSALGKGTRGSPISKEQWSTQALFFLKKKKSCLLEANGTLGTNATCRKDNGYMERERERGRKGQLEKEKRREVNARCVAKSRK